jgi:hypothetical protein
VVDSKLIAIDNDLNLSFASANAEEACKLLSHFFKGRYHTEQYHQDPKFRMLNVVMVQKEGWGFQSHGCSLFDIILYLPCLSWHTDSCKQTASKKFEGVL